MDNEDLFQGRNSDEVGRLWELYVWDCQLRGELPKPDSFTIWLDERLK